MKDLIISRIRFTVFLSIMCGMNLCAGICDISNGRWWTAFTNAFAGGLLLFVIYYLLVSEIKQSIKRVDQERDCEQEPKWKDEA